MSTTWKKMWIPVIEENMWENYEMLTKFAVDDSSYVVEKAGMARTVYIPQAGAPAGVTIAGTSYPANIETREDAVVEYDIVKFEANPVLVPAEDEISTDYSKDESVINNQIGEIGEAMLYQAFVNWYPGNTQIVRTSGGDAVSGTTVPATAPSATGNRFAFSYRDVLAAKAVLDSQKGVKKNDRYLVIPSTFENELLADLAQNHNLNFSFNETDEGLMKMSGKLAGFEVYSFNEVLYTTTTGVARAVGHAGAATDNVAALAFSKSALSMAKPKKGERLWKTPSAENYGDIISMQAFFGNNLRRHDKKGVVGIVQATA